MKKILLTACVLFLLVSPQAFAHTYLDVTTPADGETVTTDIQKIELNYSGTIEEGSFFTLNASNGDEISVQSFAVENGLLTGYLETPLPNGNYTVNWNSISQDGHPLSGSYSFTVNKPEAPQTNIVNPDVQTDKTEPATKVTPPVAEKEQQNGATPLIVAGAILVVLLAISGIVLWKRKK